MTTSTLDGFKDLALDVIDPDPDNRRSELDPAFVSSIEQHGVLMPILVTAADDGRYRLIAGQRRYHAAQAAGHATIPAVIRSTDDTTAVVWQAVENLARVDLLPSQEARQVARIMSAGMRQKALAAALNRPLSWVRARLALVALPDNVQQAVDAGTYDPSDALTFAKYAERPDVIENVLSDNYRSGADLDWRLERAARSSDAARQYAELVAKSAEAGWTVHEGHSPTDAHPRAKRLSDLGVDDHDTHSGEPCHLVVVSRGWDGDPTLSLWCTDPKRHATNGASEIKAARPQRPVPESERAQREQAAATRAANAHRAEFARQAIEAKLRSRDVLEFVLPVLFDCSGQTEKKDAARLLGIEPVRDERSNWPDHTTPLTEWADESGANLTRAMLAIAYSLAVSGGPWNRAATQALTNWLDSLGYEPAS